MLHNSKSNNDLSISNNSDFDMLEDGSYVVSFSADEIALGNVELPQVQQISSNSTNQLMNSAKNDACRSTSKNNTMKFQSFTDFTKKLDEKFEEIIISGIQSGLRKFMLG